jgi:hypothetical protein
MKLAGKREREDKRTAAGRKRGWKSTGCTGMLLQSVSGNRIH